MILKKVYWKIFFTWHMLLTLFHKLGFKDSPEEASVLVAPLLKFFIHLLSSQTEVPTSVWCWKISDILFSDVFWYCNSPWCKECALLADLKLATCSLKHYIEVKSTWIKTGNCCIWSSEMLIFLTANVIQLWLLLYPSLVTFQHKHASLN